MMPITWGSYAKTATTMDAAWTGTLVASALQSPSSPYMGIVHPLQTIQVAGMGCTARIELYAYGLGGDAAGGGWPAEAVAEYAAYSAWLLDLIGPPIPRPPPEPPHSPAGGTWWLWRFYVTAPGDSDEHYVCTGAGWPLDGDPVSWYGANNFSCAFTASMSDCVLKVRGGDNHPATRQVRDFIDQHVSYAWFALDTTTSTITMSTPKGDLTASGAWGSGPAVGEFASDWQTTFALGYTITYNANASINTDYGQIRPQWDSVDIPVWALDDRYYDAAWHHWWDGSEFQSPWPPVGETSNYRAYGDGEYIKMRRETTPDSGLSWTGSSGVPYILAVKIESGKWDDAGGDW